MEELEVGDALCQDLLEVFGNEVNAAIGQHENEKQAYGKERCLRGMRAQHAHRAAQGLREGIHSSRRVTGKKTRNLHVRHVSKYERSGGTGLPEINSAHPQPDLAPV